MKSLGFAENILEWKQTDDSNRNVVFAMVWAISSHVMGGHNQNPYHEHLKVQIEDNIKIYRHYRQISNITRTQTQNLNVSRLNLR